MEKRSTIFSPLIWLLCLIAIAIIVFAVAFIVALYRNRPIAFDSDQWKFAPKNANLDIRYRMTVVAQNRISLVISSGANLSAQFHIMVII
jgi:hypothetical protein